MWTCRQRLPERSGVPSRYGDLQSRPPTLILKAVTAPFSSSASALGGSDALDSVAFAPGSAQLDEGARQGLEKIAQAMLEQPCAEDDRGGPRPAPIPRAMPGAASACRGAAGTKTPTGTRRWPIGRRHRGHRAWKYIDACSKRCTAAPMSPNGATWWAWPKTTPQAEMEALLLAHTAVPENAMQDLALARAVAVRDHLAARGLPLERCFWARPRAWAQSPTGSPTHSWCWPRVESGCRPMAKSVKMAVSPARASAAARSVTASLSPE